MYEDPQITMSRLSRLSVNLPAQASASSSATPAAQPMTTSQMAKPVSVPIVSDISPLDTNTSDITVSQEYVNKVVQSLGSLRSAVVSRRLAPVLNERSFR